MNKVQIDFSRNQPVFSNTVAGYIGEHNATTLIVVPPDSMTNDSDIVSYTIAFKTKDGQKYLSNTFTKNTNITMLLNSQLTTGDILYIQLEGYGRDKNIIAKSETVFLRFGNSLNGNGSTLDSNIKPQENIIQFGWVPENKDVLSKFNESRGVILYDGVDLDMLNQFNRCAILLPQNYNYSSIKDGVEVDIDYTCSKIRVYCNDFPNAPNEGLSYKIKSISFYVDGKWITDDEIDNISPNIKITLYSNKDYVCEIENLNQTPLYDYEKTERIIGALLNYMDVPIRIEYLTRWIF